MHDNVNHLQDNTRDQHGPHWIAVNCHSVEGPMTTGYYCAVFPFCGGGKKKRWQKNKGVLRLGYHRYPSKKNLKNNIFASVQRVVCCSHQSDRLGYVSRTNQSVGFVLRFESCSNFNEAMRDSERAVRNMESSFRWEILAFLCFLTCILPRFMRNAILQDRRKISDYL